MTTDRRVLILPTVLNRHRHNYGRDIYAGTRDWPDTDAEHVGIAATMELAEHIVHAHNSAVRANLR